MINFRKNLENKDKFVQKGVYSLADILSVIPEVRKAGNGKNLNISFLFLKAYEDKDINFFIGGDEIDQKQPETLGILFNPSFFDQFKKNDITFNDIEFKNDNNESENGDDELGEGDDEKEGDNVNEEIDNSIKESINKKSKEVINEAFLGIGRKKSKKADVDFHQLDMEEINDIAVYLKKHIKEFGFVFTFDKLSYVDKVPDKKKNNANYVSGMSR